jgi:glycosyltransferase involved in cell wall biosynthesis
MNTPKLHIAGSFDSGDSEQKNANSTIVYHGFVEDPADFMRSHGILLTPVRTGSGVRIKLLEALSLGVPCITTPLGALGIEDWESPLLIAETPKEWLTAMQTLHDSEVARRELGERGRVYMEKYHSFATVNAQMKAALGT